MNVTKLKAPSSEAEQTLLRSGFTAEDGVFSRDVGDFRAQIRIVAGNWSKLVISHKETLTFQDASGDITSREDFVRSYGSGFFGKVEVCIAQGIGFMQLMSAEDSKLAMPVIGEIRNGRTPMDAARLYNRGVERRQIKRNAYGRMAISCAKGHPEELTRENAPYAKKMIHSFFRYLSMFDEGRSLESADSFVQTSVALRPFCSILTPREFTEIFPVTKKFNGERFGVKDYFSTMKIANELGMDTPLGVNATRFLVEYNNPIVDEVILSEMSAVSTIRRSQGKKDMFDLFVDICKFKEDVTTEIVRDKLKEGINGFEWLVLNTHPTAERQRQLVEALVEHDGIDEFLSVAKRSLQKGEKLVHDMQNIRDLLTHASLLRERKYDSYIQMLRDLYESEGSS